MAGRRFAAWDVPWRRRLQTLAVLWFLVQLAAHTATFFFMCAIPLLWPIVIGYFLWLTFDDAPETGKGRRVQFLRRHRVWRYYAGFFPITLHKTVDLDPGETYVFGYHPHGFISMGAWGNFATEGTGFEELFPGIRNSLLTLATNFRIPLYRDYLLFHGVHSVSRKSCERLLSKGPGSAITIVAGGAQESLLAQPRTLNLILKKRQGFIKLAIRKGSHLVPVLSFGEADLFEQVESAPSSSLYKVQQAIKKCMGFTVPVVHARGIFNYDFGMIPYRHPIHTVVGRPIATQQNDAPGEEQVAAVQSEYIAVLQGLWDAHKDEYAADRDQEMKIVA